MQSMAGMSEVSSAGSRRFDALTGFRALAASLVFVYHNRKYWRGELHPELLRLINEFHIGVSLFFVLSGFLIAYTYGAKPAERSRDYLRYILIRMARIFPLYWLILTAYYLDPGFAKEKAYFLTYSLAHGFSSKYNLSGIAQAWSLNVEFCFYLLAPFLCLLQKRHWLWLFFAIIVIFGLYWATGVIWHAGNGNPNLFFYPNTFLLSSSFPGRATEFVAGMILAQHLLSGKNWSLPHKTAIGFAGIFITSYGIGCFQPDIYHEGTTQTGGLLLHMWLLPAFVAISLYGLISEKTWLQQIFSARIMVLLGNASFAFYLIHISYVNLRIKSLYLGPDRNFILLWIVSIALYLLIEKPIYDAIRKAVKRAR